MQHVLSREAVTDSTGYLCEALGLHTERFVPGAGRRWIGDQACSGSPLAESVHGDRPALLGAEGAQRLPKRSTAGSPELTSSSFWGLRVAVLTFITLSCSHEETGRGWVAARDVLQADWEPRMWTGSGMGNRPQEQALESEEV